MINVGYTTILLLVSSLFCHSEAKLTSTLWGLSVEG
jgi:hypothetical protein